MLMNFKITFIISILTLFKVYYCNSFTKYTKSTQQKLRCKELDKETIRNVYDIDKNTFAILLDDDSFSSCDKNNQKCSFIERYVKFVITYSQRIALLLDNKIEFGNSNELSNFKYEDLNIDLNTEKTAAAYFKNGLNIGATFNGTHPKLLTFQKEVNFTLKKNLTIFNRAVLCQLLIPEDGHIAIASDDHTIKIVDIHKDFLIVDTLTGHRGGVWKIIKLFTGELLSADYEGIIIKWQKNKDTKKYEGTIVMTDPNSKFVNMIQLDNWNVVASTINGTALILDPQRNFRLIKTIGNNEGPNSMYRALVQLKNGHLVTGSYDTFIRVYDPSNDYYLVKEFPADNNRIVCLLQVSSGLLASGGDSYAIKFWDPDKNYSPVSDVSHHKSSVMSMTELTNGMLASASADNTTIIWDLDDFNKYSEKQTLNGHTATINSVLALPNGNLLTAGYDTNVLVWEKSLKLIKSESTINTDRKINLIESIDSLTVLSSSSDFIFKYEYNDTTSTFNTSIARPVSSIVTDIKKLNNTTAVSSFLNGSIAYWNTEKLEITKLVNLSSLINNFSRFIKEPFHAKKVITSNQTGEMIALLNNSNFIIFDPFKFETIFISQNSAETDDIIDVIKTPTGWNIIFSNGNIGIYEFKPRLFLNTKIRIGRLNFCQVLMPLDSLKYNQFKIINKPKCLDLTLIKPISKTLIGLPHDIKIIIDDIYSCSDELNYHLISNCRDDLDTLKLSFSGNEYEIIVFSMDPPEYKNQKITVNQETSILFNDIPFEDDIIKIQFFKAGKGSIGYSKIQNDNKCPEEIKYNIEYDTKYTFCYTTGAETEKDLADHLQFKITDKYGISSELINLDISTDFYKSYWKRVKEFISEYWIFITILSPIFAFLIRVIIIYFRPKLWEEMKDKTCEEKFVIYVKHFWGCCNCCRKNTNASSIPQNENDVNSREPMINPSHNSSGTFNQS